MDMTSCPVSPAPWTRSMKVNGTPVLDITIRRPAFPDSGKTQRIEKYFSQLTQCWQTRWETSLYQKAAQALTEQSNQHPFLPWKATMDYQITFWDPPLISLQINIQEQGPVTPSTLLCIGEVWDCNTGYPCSLRTFLSRRPHRWKRALIHQLQEQAEQRLNSGESLLYPDSLSSIKQTFDPNRFYLTEEGIAIFYPLYILGSYGEGIPTFTIPIEEQIQSNKFLALSKTAQR